MGEEELRKTDKRWDRSDKEEDKKFQNLVNQAIQFIIWFRMNNSPLKNSLFGQNFSKKSTSRLIDTTKNVPDIFLVSLSIGIYFQFKTSPKSIYAH